MSAGAPTLDGSNSGVVIKAPADVVGTALDPWNAGGGTRAINAIVTVIGVANVSIENLTIDGDGKAATGNAMVGATATAVFDYVGIAYVNASGALDHVTVQEVRDGPLNGVQRGQAIYATNAAANADKAFAVTDSLVTDFQKTGILVRNMDVTLTGNTITGADATGLIAQNGIQVGQDSTGDISGNTISGMGYIGAANATSSGMYLWNSADLTVTDNSITGVGMSAINGGGSGSSVGIIADGIDGSTITGNQLHDAVYGVWEFNDINPENNVDQNSYDDVAVNHKLAPTGSLTNAFTPAGTDGVDNYAGAAGNDILTGQGGNDTLKGGAGIDTALYSDAPVVVWDNADNRWEITSVDGSEVLAGSHGIEIVDGGGTVGGPRIWLVGGGSDVTTIQALFDGVAANGEAAAGDTIMLASGTYAGNLTIDRTVTILGANQGANAAGLRQAESVIDGQWQINTGSKVVIDGVKFLDDTPVTFDPADNFVALRINVHGDHEVRDSIFARVTSDPDQAVFHGLGSTQTHRAIELASVPAGETVEIVGNLFTSDNHTYWYGGDNWRTGIYSNGGLGTTIDRGQHVRIPAQRHQRRRFHRHGDDHGQHVPPCRYGHRGGRRKRWTECRRVTGQHDHRKYVRCGRYGLQLPEHHGGGAQLRLVDARQRQRDPGADRRAARSRQRQCGHDRWNRRAGDPRRQRRRRRAQRAGRKRRPGRRLGDDRLTGGRRLRHAHGRSGRRHLCVPVHCRGRHRLRHAGGLQRQSRQDRDQQGRLRRAVGICRRQHARRRQFRLQASRRGRELQQRHLRTDVPARQHLGRRRAQPLVR
jgi:hypothetical protein